MASVVAWDHGACGTGDVVLKDTDFSPNRTRSLQCGRTFELSEDATAVDRRFPEPKLFSFFHPNYDDLLIVQREVISIPP